MKSDALWCFVFATHFQPHPWLKQRKWKRALGGNQKAHSLAWLALAVQRAFLDWKLLLFPWLEQKEFRVNQTILNLGVSWYPKYILFSTEKDLEEALKKLIMTCSNNFLSLKELLGAIKETANSSSQWHQWRFWKSYSGCKAKDQFNICWRWCSSHQTCWALVILFWKCHSLHSRSFSSCPKISEFLSVSSIFASFSS